ncbi:MAG: hypothetical protein IT316_14620 [Anaerolineales bacterium]|nr:hypothetical protein [Anaerolineales bacterium]
MILAEHVIEKLIQIESDVHYSELPPPDQEPFILVDRQSPVIISAPHGAMTYRNNGREIWHEEDEYTAGMALLLAELCKVSVIATIWRTADSDPNEHSKDQSGYKKKLDALFENGDVHWLIDLHGAGKKSRNLADTQLVDLGIGKCDDYLPIEATAYFRKQIENYLGQGVTSREGKNGFPASDPNRIAAFAKSYPNVYSVQVEMKPKVRIPRRRVDASMFTKSIEDGGGPYSAPAHHVVGMMQAIVDFIEYLKGDNYHER